MRFIIAFILALILSAPAFAVDACAPRPDAAPAIARLQAVMATGRFIAYQPTALKVFDGNLTGADEASIEADLKVLRPWFDGLITYGALAGAERVPDVAAKLGFRAVIIGVWDPSNTEELNNALTAAKRHPQLVAGLSLGNEIIFGKRGNWLVLEETLKTVRRRAPSLPLALTEPFAQFLDDKAAAPALEQTDFMLANIHPVFEKWFATAPAFNWADFVVQIMTRLEASYCRPILVKETGVPTGPASEGFDEAKQAAFYRELERQLPPARKRAFAYFTAFDAPWRVHDFNPVAGVHPEEAHWGLFSESRVPKPVMTALPKLR
jgi:exo-beta-1,3-glucanase (GH17 family)